MASNSEEGFPEILRFIGGVGGFFWGLTVGDADPELNTFITGVVGGIMLAAAGWIAGKVIDAAIIGVVLVVTGLLALIPAAIWGFRIYSYFAA